MPVDPWARTVVRWAGSKKRLLPILMWAAPQAMEQYVEPFAGSAALFFALRPQRALLGDFNDELITALTVLRDHPRKLHRAVSSIPRTKAQYYYLRDRTGCDEGDHFCRSVRFMYLNRNCFNGLYRTNRSGHYNVPFGSGMGQVPSERDYYRCSIALRKATLRAWDFRKTLAAVQQGDFVYADPPYYTSRSTYGEYGYGAFEHRDMSDLVELLIEAHRRGAHVLLSYAYDDTLVREFDHWDSLVVSVRRHLAAKATTRSAAIEVLLSNRPFPTERSGPVSRLLSGGDT